MLSKSTPQCTRSACCWAEVLGTDTETPRAPSPHRRPHPQLPLERGLCTSVRPSSPSS